MIRFVQNGKYRTTNAEIKSFVDGVEITGNGFPITVSLLEAFGSFSKISEFAIGTISDTDYNIRVTAFKNYLIGKYSFLSLSDFQNVASGTDNVICNPGTLVGENVIPITPDTNILIFFDSSGSMVDTKDPLIDMVNKSLKDILKPFYNNDDALYASKTRFITDPSEKFLYFLRNRDIGLSGKNLIMVFQDEARDAAGRVTVGYHQYSFSPTSPRLSMYNSDINLLRSELALTAANSYRGCIFQVKRNDAEGVAFKSFLKAIETGEGNYAGEFGLSDKPEIGFEYDIEDGQNEQYYTDIVVKKMRELGYKL